MDRISTKIVLIVTLPVLFLSGCVRFGSKPPPSLLTLRPLEPVVAAPLDISSAGTSITVMDPEAPQALDTVRVPVSITPTTVAYVKKAQWADTPRHLFRQLLSEALVAEGGLLVLEPGQYSINPGQRLLGELLEFGIDAQKRQAIVTYEATLTGGEGARILRKRFSASAPVKHIDADRVGGPLNVAANMVATDVARWVKDNRLP